ncbi:MAG: hypothetical protein ACTSV2_01865 [Candidatus Thorarchaeota archaeon]
MGQTKLQEMKRAVDADPENLDKLLELGKYAADRFIVGVSEESLLKVARHRPDDPEVLALLAKVLNRRRKLSESEKVYRHALEISPDSPELLTGLGVVNGNLGNLEECKKWLGKALDVDPGYSWAVHAMNHSLGLMGHKGEIESVLKRGIEANGESALILINYSMYLLEKGATNEYQRYLDKGLNALFQAGPEEQSRALIILVQKKPGIVIEYGERLLKEDPDNSSIVLPICMVKGQIKPDEVIVELKKELQKDPHNMRLMSGLMATLLHAKDIAGAMELKARMTADAPEDGILELVDMVLTRTDIGGLITSEKVRARYIESTYNVLQRFPVSIAAHFNYIRALMADQRTEEASAQIQYIRDNIPIEDSQSAHLFGLLLQQSNMHREAEDVFKQARDLAETPFESLFLSLNQLSVKEKYSDISVLIEDFMITEKAEPGVYAILGRVQSYIEHPDAQRNLQIAADGNQYDAMILLASLVRKDIDPVRASKLLQDVIGAEDADKFHKARALLGMNKPAEGIKLLEEIIAEDPTDILSWNLLILARKSEGIDVVKSLVKKMLDSTSSRDESAGSKDYIQSTKIDEVVDRFANEVKIGELAGSIKSQILNRQIIALQLDSQREDL